MGNRLSAELSIDSKSGSSDAKRRRMDKNNILTNKRMFFVRRDMDSERGTYFEHSITKIICNSKEFHKYYQIVGGIVCFPHKKADERIDIKFHEIVRECHVFGSYVYTGPSDPKLRTLLIERKKDFPQKRAVSCQGTVNSVIPRYDGNSGYVVIGMIIVSSSLESERKWTRYDDPQHIHENKGLFEMTQLTQIRRLLDVVGDSDDLFAIYVGINTSLLMVDVTQPHLINYKLHHNVYTLFQEGAVIAFNCKLYFSFCEEEEDVEYDSNTLYDRKRQILDNSYNLDLLGQLKSQRSCRRVLFLRSAPKKIFWTLKVRRFSDGFPLECQLCIPSGGQFEVMKWKEGLKLVSIRQNQRRWSKYIESMLSGRKYCLPKSIGLKLPYPPHDYGDQSDDQDVNDIFFGPYL